MPTHTMSKDTNPLPINLLKVLEDRLRQLGRDVAIHLIPFTPRFLRSIKVKACAGAEVVGVVFASDLQAA